MPLRALDTTSQSLLELARSEDQEAWRRLVNIYGPLVHRWCKRGGLGEDDIADVFQETFRAVACHLNEFAPTKAVGSFRSWLRTIVRSKVADHFRRRNDAAVALGGTAAQIEMANLQDPLAEDSVEQAQDDHALVVQQAMELVRPEFSDRNWAAFERVALNGDSAADVARELSISPQTIRQANYRIRRRLRVILEDLVDDDVSGSETP